MARLNEGEPAAAAEQFAASVWSQPGYAPARNNLGVALGRLGKFAEAETAFGEAVRLDPALSRSLV